MNRQRKTHYAVHRLEVIPCHRVTDKDGRGPYAADSKRDKRRFRTAYGSRSEAMEKALEYSENLKHKD